MGPLKHPPALGRRRGSYAIEFALCLPVWLIAVSSIYDFAWTVHQRTALDSALNMGCRSGAMIDPGEWDDNLGQAFAVAEASTWLAFEDLGHGACEGCVFEAEVMGTEPDRILRCQVEQDLAPLVGMAYGDQSVTAVQAALFEWQHP